jgi:hypothetical protein
VGGAEVFFPLFSPFPLLPPFLPLAPTGTAEVQIMATTAGINRPKQQSFIVAIIIRLDTLAIADVKKYEHQQ